MSSAPGIRSGLTRGAKSNFLAGSGLAACGLFDLEPSRYQRGGFACGRSRKLCRCRRMLKTNLPLNPLRPSLLVFARVVPYCSVSAQQPEREVALMIAAPARSQREDLRTDPRPPRGCGRAARATPLASAPGSCPPTPPLERLAVETDVRNDSRAPRAAAATAIALSQCRRRWLGLDRSRGDGRERQ